ncbi:PREDICTED: piRNA biogenesis protein EXD1 [Nanorana parkeri]|uniref:piRNA biogenesis protein EXD1 n=1 Tax=Nanorana parkeri TaxID=125878 RepID=UPI000854A776|nr:PREDICTED: piRNA biogenesis protein EXD1 [Nanorana parkeri]
MDPAPSILSCIIGKTMKITTTNGCFQGVLFSVHADRAFTLIKVKDLKTGEAVQGAKLFFGQHVLNVEQVEESKSVGQEVEGETLEERSHILSLTTAQSNQEEPFNALQEIQHAVEPVEESKCVGQEVEGKALKERSHILLLKTAQSNQDEPFNALQAIKHAVDTEEVVYTVIDQFQTLFQPTIRHLQRQKVLSLAAACLKLGHYQKLCWLQVATRNHVYLFDILTMGPGVFKNGLQVMLQDKSILKVIHDGRLLADILFHQYGVTLTNVFDTQVGDVYLFSMETGGFLPQRTATLKDCLIRYLNMPSTHVNFLNVKQTLMKGIPNVWSDRPISATLLKVLALEVLHLLDLRQVMLDNMLADFTLLVNSYLNAPYPGRANALNRTEISCSELPKELQLLCVLQQERRTKALKEYDVNQQGFLTRS